MKEKKLLIIAALIFIVVLPVLGKPDRKPVYITNITIINPADERIQPGMTVIVSENKITKIDNAGMIKVPDHAQVLVGKNKYLIPGLWDMHVHLSYYGNYAETGSILVAYGVTGVRDMGGDLKEIDLWQAKIKSGKQTGPRIIRSGLVVDGPKPDVEYRLFVNNEKQAREAVVKLKQMGVDFIKIHNRVPRDAFFALALQASKENISFAGHIPYGVSAEEASSAGMRSIEHTEVLLEASIFQKYNPVKNIEEAIKANTGKNGAQLFSSFVKNDTWYVPTLVAYRAQVLAPENKKTRTGRQKLFEQLIKIVGEMHNAGVNIMTGTDFFSPDYGIQPGFSLHEELHLLVKAGFTHMEALKAATIKPAIFLNRKDHQGSIKVGNQADLVLLDKNPLKDITNTRTIRAVIIRGRVVNHLKIQKIITTNKRKETGTGEKMHIEKELEKDSGN